MPSSEFARGLLRAVLLLCVCTQGAAAAVDGPDTATSTSGCFPAVDRVERGEAVGDAVELEMLLCFSGSVSVTGPTYAANATLGDGNWSGSVTLEFDTRRKGSRALSVTTDRDHSVAAAINGSGSFEPGTYTVTVRGWGGDVVDTVNFTLGEPRGHDVTIAKAPKGASSNLDSVAAVREAMAQSPTDSARQLDDPDYDESLPVATNETLIVALRADGLEGAIASEGETPLSRFRAALEDAGGGLTMQQTEETVTPERKPLAPNLLNSSATHLVADPVNDTYYLVVDTQRLHGKWGGSHGGPVTVGARPGMGYAVRFSMQGTIDDETLPSDLVSADLLIEEAAVAAPEGNSEPIALPARKNATLRFRTTLATGTPVTVYVTGHPSGPLNRSRQVQRGTEEAIIVLDVNLSAVPNRTTLEVTVEREGKVLDSEVAAVVGTATPTETTTPTASPTTSQPATASATDTDSDKPTASPTTRERVPGFGFLPGVTSLLVAVLALRRLT